MLLKKVALFLFSTSVAEAVHKFFVLFALFVVNILNNLTTKSAKSTKNLWMTSKV